MSHYLVSFLGAQKEGQYPLARYDFPDGHSEQAAYFGFPLQKWLEANRLVIFGTAGSMWDHLFEHQIESGNENPALGRLMDATAKENVQQPQLDATAKLLADELGCEVRLQIIPTALEAIEQAELVQLLAAAAQGASKLSLDVTHGYRHLPMLVVMAALYLRFVRRDIDIAGLWYGAFDPATKIAPAHDLGGLLETADWLAALQRNDLLGDYEGIAQQIENNGRIELARKFRSASHFQNIHQEHKAQPYIRESRSELKEQHLAGPGGLFQSELMKRTNWVDEQSRYTRQRQNAFGALARKDHMRAALMGLEAFITGQTLTYFSRDDEFDQGRRDDAVGLFLKDGTTEQKRAHALLNGIRNVIAHGNRPDHNNPKTQAAVQRAIKSADNLDAALSDCFDTLLPREIS